MKNLNINEVLNVENANIIDVRESFEYAGGTVPGAINIPMIGLITNADQFLKKEEEYFIMCQAGSRSMNVCSSLEEQGYNVTNLEGGYGSFKK